MGPLPQSRGGGGFPGSLRVSRSVLIPPGELQWRFSGSGGPGGQHANTANTRVELLYDVGASGALGPRQRARVLARHGPVIRVVVSDERSQIRNRQIALDRLTDRLLEALTPQRPRIPTSPSRASKERRLMAKKLRATRKLERRPGEPWD